MRPQLESIHISEADTSFVCFVEEAEAFLPYWHYHPELELTYIESGEGLRFVGDHIAPFEPGDLVLIGENLPHQWVSDESVEAELHRAVVVQFPFSLLTLAREMLPIRELAHQARRGLHFPAPNPGLVSRLMGLVACTPLRRLTALYEILDQLQRMDQVQVLSDIHFREAHKWSRHQRRVAKVNQYLLAHLQEPIGLERIATFSNMSPPAFSRWFRQSLGQSFVKYLNRLRIEKACHYLIQTDWQISTIAFQVGFESVSNFNRTFKRIKALSPRTYRAQAVIMAGVER